MSPTRYTTLVCARRRVKHKCTTGAAPLYRARRRHLLDVGVHVAASDSPCETQSAPCCRHQWLRCCMLAFNVPVPACMLSTLDCDITSIGKVVVSAARHRRCACCTLQLVPISSVLGDDTVSVADSDRYLCVDARQRRRRDETTAGLLRVEPRTHMPEPGRGSHSALLTATVDGRATPSPNCCHVARRRRPDTAAPMPASSPNGQHSRRRTARRSRPGLCRSPVAMCRQHRPESVSCAARLSGTRSSISWAKKACSPIDHYKCKLAAFSAAACLSCFFRLSRSLSSAQADTEKRRRRLICVDRGADVMCQICSGDTKTLLC